MSSTDHRIPYDLALRLALEVVQTLAPHCARIEIAGSLRRQKPDIGDLEIVCIPADMEETDLLGRPLSGLYRLESAIAQLYPVLMGGHKMRKFRVPYGNSRFDWIGCDLFITTPDQWGTIFMIRTGCAEFSKWMVTTRREGGALPSCYHLREGQVIYGDHAYPMREEADYFHLCGLEVIDPIKRDKGYWGLWAQLEKRG